MNAGLANWAILIVSMLVAVMGLLLAGKSVDFGMELAGWLFFAFGVGLSFRFAGKMALGDDAG